MLRLRRRVGERVRVTDPDGHFLMLTVLAVTPGRRGEVLLGFSDLARNFEIDRVESVEDESDRLRAERERARIA